MFSTIQSFLPAALQSGGADKHATIDEVDDEDDEHDFTDTHGTQGSSATGGADEHGLKKKSKRDRTNETFIVVRPPPAKNNHPLNLQVQLVPPSQKGDNKSSRASFDFSAPTDDGASTTGGGDAGDYADTESRTELSRSESRRSNTSYGGSVSSFSSYSSNTTGGGRRMIVPLYTLQAHNVMTNIVVDAGTDAKVAKFGKRGIEVINLAVLEPVEVWSKKLYPVRSSMDLRKSPSLPSTNAGAHSAQPSFTSTPPTQGGLLAPIASAAPGSRPTTPESSAHSITSSVNLPSHNLEPPTSPQTSEPQTSRKRDKLFGKLFKKRSERDSSPDPHTTPTPSSPDVSTSTQANLLASPTRSSFSSGRPTSGLFHAVISPESSPETQTTPLGNAGARPACLGVQPSLSSPVHPPVGRPSKYVWVVRKWVKGGDTGLLTGAMGRLNVAGHSMGHVSKEGQLPQLVEVRFEWARGKAKGKGGDRGRGRHGTSHTGGSSAGHSVSSLGDGTGSGKKTSPPRAVSMSRHSSGTHTDDPHPDHITEPEHDDGEDSDPEDSETPWTCTLRLCRVSASNSNLESTPVKLKVATLSPTPHHPKVVALLKVPFPLPDVDVGGVSLVKRILTPEGMLKPAPGVGVGSVALLAEEIKDVVSTTALWLVVREAFGGVGRVSRKGDGWRIRA